MPSIPREHPFDYQLAMDRLQSFRAPRDKLRHLCKEGAVVRIKKGLYVPGWRRGDEAPVDRHVLAGLIYGPSYVSLESALEYHGLIPERVEEVTSVTIKRAKLFHTPMGRYRYHPIPERVFPMGVRLEQARGGGWFLAEPEKALCDRLSLNRSLAAVRDVEAVLTEDLRVDLDAVRGFRRPLVRDIAKAYRRKSVTAFEKWLSRQPPARFS
ncbi:MAG: hypothetical protein KDK99_20830 [Verrucomicrobiales bacterium]|nr:hypothetical protein [Verrucomicrobiales bacterium]